MKERLIRQLGPEVRQALETAEELTGKRSLLRRVQALPREARAKMARPSPNEPYEIHLFGISLILLLLGIGILFFNGRSPSGWILTGIGALVILLGILLHLNIYFRATSLFSTLAMLILLVAGLGLVARSRLA